MNRYLANLKAVAIGAALLALLSAVPISAYGQAISGNLVGTVIDPSSAVVTNASVEATKIDTGVSTTTVVKNNGTYRFDNLPVGAYRITVKSAGFKTSILQVDVALNQTGTLNVTLSPGGTSETVEVSGVAA